MFQRSLSRYRLAVLPFLLALVALLPGCGSVDPARYAKEKPLLEMRDYFNGTIDAWGVVTDRSGEVIKRFTVVMRCEWRTIDGVETGILDEDFLYSDGTRQKRVWKVRKLGPGQYAGTADDVVGEAAGVSSGNALNWRYTLALPLSGRTWHIQFDDWMYLMDGEVMLNRAVMSKFGIRVGEVTLSFRKRSS